MARRGRGLPREAGRLALLALAVPAILAGCAAGQVFGGDSGPGDAVDRRTDGSVDEETGDAGDSAEPPADATDGTDDAVGPTDDGDGADTACGPAGACDDGIACTLDSCDPVTVRCIHEPQGSLCDDGDPCTGAEVCDVVLGCLAGTPVDCDDGIACTVDSCNAGSGGCDHVTSHRLCSPPQICDPARGGCVDPPACTTDADCDDHQYCTGTERCTPSRLCAPGMPPVCDDGIACTVDRCDPTAAGGAGACVSVPPDRDGDGYGDAACYGTDCDDANAALHPGATELCNAADDDCDAATDETFTCVRGSATSCSASGGCTGVMTCGADCRWGSCTVAITEVCNGLDDNCNALIDETFACPYASTRGCTVGACVGTQSCGSGCTWGSCVVPIAEVCNALDDNCNGATDEGFSCIVGTTGGCTNSCGAAGSQTCQGPSCTWGPCCGPLEVCGNACDDDCDGSFNEGCGGPTCTVVEGFEAGYWPAPGWSGGAGIVSSASAHDGSYGIQDPDWPYRTDVTVGNPGDRLTVWVRPDGVGRAYIGFAASATGCKSFLAAPNSPDDIRFQDNAGWGFTELNTSPQTWVLGQWYKMEIEFYAGNNVTGRLYAADGTTLLNSVSQAYGTSVVGGIALRSFGPFAIDTISICR